LRDRLCLIQLSAGDGIGHIVQFQPGMYAAPNLKRVLADERITKIFHFGRFDIAVIAQYLGIVCRPVYCTKIASRLTRTYTDRHGLKDLCAELLGVDLSKQQQTSDWGRPELTQDQLNYAASDVLYLHRLRDALNDRLARENRQDLAKSCFEFLPSRAQLDLAGWPEQDIFAH
jgi:ribonuclease D